MKAYVYKRLFCGECGFVLQVEQDYIVTETVEKKSPYILCTNRSCKEYMVKYKLPVEELELVCE